MAAGHFMGLGFNALEDSESFVPRSPYPLPSPSPASLLAASNIHNHNLHIHLGLEANPNLPSLLPQPHPVSRAPFRLQPLATVAVSFGSRPAGLQSFRSSPHHSLLIPPPPASARPEQPPRASWANPAHQLSSDRRYVHSPLFGAAPESRPDLRGDQDQPAASPETGVSSAAPAAISTHSDNTFDLLARMRTPGPREPNSDDYLQALVNGDFSSPSISPEDPSPSSQLQSSSAQDHGGLPPDSAQANPGGGAFHTPYLDRVDRAAGADGLFSQASSERPSLGFSQDFFSWLSPLVHPTAGRTAAEDNMPAGRASRKRPGPSTARPDRSSDSPAPKRRRQSTSSQVKPEERSAKVPKRQAKQPAAKVKEYSDPFSEDEDNEGLINLTTDAPEPQPPAKKDNSIKLGDFQCVICMDDVTDLTVTYCGHLFCSECLHSALHIDANKKTCPVCRQKIDIRPATSKSTSKSKGYWPLELKLMTRRRAGKQVSR